MGNSKEPERCNVQGVKNSGKRKKNTTMEIEHLTVVDGFYGNHCSHWKPTTSNVKGQQMTI